MPWVVELWDHDASLIIYFCESHGYINHHYEYLFSLLYAPPWSLNIVICSCCVKSGRTGSDSCTPILKVYLDYRSNNWSKHRCCYLLRKDINRTVLHQYWGDHCWNRSSFLVFRFLLLFRLCNVYPMWNNERNGKDLAIHYSSPGVILHNRHSLWNHSGV